jgi:hypothetical protein
MKFKLRIRGKMAAVLCLGLSFFLAAGAGSYVLQGAHVIDLMAQRLGRADSLYLLQKQIIYPESPPQVSADCPGGNCPEPAVAPPPDLWQMQPAAAEAVPAPQEPIVIPEAVRYVFSRAFRSDLESDAASRIYVSSGGRSLTIVDGVRTPEARNRFDWYKDLLLYRERPRLVEHLSHLGVDVSVTSLGRFEGQIAYVLGAIYPDESVVQVWIDKETFRPLRWIIPGAAGGGTDALDIRYFEWRDLGEIRYPMRIEFFQNGEMTRVIEAERYEVDAGFSNDLFDIERLRAEYPATAETASGAGSREGMSDIQRALEDFKRLFE